MPSGRTHEVFNTALLPLSLLLPNSVELLPFVFGYVTATFFFSPDIDLSRSRVAMRWGLLRIIWMPYSKVASHRRVSHIPVIGLLMRVAYLCVIVAIPIAVLKAFGINVGFKNLRASSAHLISFALGMLVADTLHIVLDLLTSAFKKLISRLR
jgi:uncharacterized metal-binding protein